jgi:hypothetical protein
MIPVMRDLTRSRRSLGLSAFPSMSRFPQPLHSRLRFAPLGMTMERQAFIEVLKAQ